MSPIETKITIEPTLEKVDYDGEYTFSLFTSTECENEFTDAMNVMSKIWDMDLNAEVCIHIDIKLRSVYKSLRESVISGDETVMEIEKRYMPLAQALRKDCQWIIEQIDLLKEIENEEI